MPLTSKGEKIKKAMQQQYGAKKGEEVFYASKNKGTISGVEGRARALRRFGESMRRRHGRGR